MQRWMLLRYSNMSVMGLQPSLAQLGCFSSSAVVTKKEEVEEGEVEYQVEWIGSVGGRGIRVQVCPAGKGDSEDDCGNSALTAKLSDAGFTSIVSTDYAEKVVANMRDKYDATHHNIEWTVADCTNLADFTDESFDLVVEKSVLDAMVSSEGSVWSPNEATRDNVAKALRSVSRVLAPEGSFISIHFQQPHFRKAYLDGKHSSEQFGWGNHIVTSPIEAGLGFFYTRCIKSKRKNIEQIE